MPRAGYLADGEWHVLVFKINKEKITMNVDNLFAHVEEPGLERIANYKVINMYLGKFSYFLFMVLTNTLKQKFLYKNK